MTDPPATPADEPPVEEFPERFRSKQIVLDIREAAMPGSPARVGVEEDSTVAGEDRSSKFLAAAASLGDRSAKAHGRSSVSTRWSRRAR